MPRRRDLLRVAGMGVVGGIAGCTTSDGQSGNGQPGQNPAGVVATGSTDYDGEWYIKLSPGDRYEVSLTLESGNYATAGVAYAPTATQVASLDIEDAGETRSTEFEAPSDLIDTVPTGVPDAREGDNYIVIVTVDSLECRRCGAASFSITSTSGSP